MYKIYFGLLVLQPPPHPNPIQPSPKQGCHGDGRTDTSVRPSVTFDKVLVGQIRVNAMLTSDKVKPELLCPRWLPRWMAGCKLPLYCTGYRAHSSMEGANGCHRGAYGHRVGRTRMK
jgi:hypothetical protein